MTEIPQHLLERARVARERAMSAEDDPSIPEHLLERSRARRAKLIPAAEPEQRERDLDGNREGRTIAILGAPGAAAAATKQLYGDDDPRVPVEMPFVIEAAVRIDWHGGVPSEVVETLRGADCHVAQDLRGFAEGRVALTATDLDAAIESLGNQWRGCVAELDEFAHLDPLSYMPRLVDRMERARNILRAYREHIPDGKPERRKARWFPDMDVTIRAMRSHR